MTLQHPDADARKQQLEYQQIARAITLQPSPHLHMRVQRLCNDAKLPVRSNPTDAGHDLYATEDINIMPGHRRLVPTGIALEIPDGYVGLIWPRSGMAVKNGIDVFAGVIDSGYRGEVRVCLYNSREAIFEIKKGDRIAQILFQEIGNFNLCWTEADLQETDRGAAGFGSSGK